MANTVIGFFKDRAEAADAVSQLTRSGFDRNDIDISNGSAGASDSSIGSGSDYSTGDTNSDYNRSREFSEGDRHEQKGNAISRFFSSLFGDDDDDAKRYSTAGESADSIVTVHAISREQAEEAANILDACGAMDIDEGSLASETYSESGSVDSASRSMDPYASGTAMSGSRMAGSDLGDSTNAGLTNTDLAAAGINPDDLSSDPDTEERFRSGAGSSTMGKSGTGYTGTGLTGAGSTSRGTSGSGSSGLSTSPMDYSDMGKSGTGSTGLASAGSGSIGLGNSGTGSGTSGTGHSGMGGTTSGSDYSGNQYSTERSSGSGISGDDLSGNDDLTSDRNLNTGNSQDRIDVIREDLQVGKKSVETGGVRVRSRIVERPVEENLRLREEHIRVNRQPVDRAASMEDLGTFQEREIELTEHAEVPVVNKEARVVEEIRISKDVNERDETIRDTVRETKVDIDDNTNKTNRKDRMGSNTGNYGNDDRTSTDLNSGRS